jgi:hypothetical protein
MCFGVTGRESRWTVDNGRRRKTPETAGYRDRGDRPAWTLGSRAPVSAESGAKVAFREECKTSGVIGP